MKTLNLRYITRPFEFGQGPIYNQPGVWMFAVGITPQRLVGRREMAEGTARRLHPEAESVNWLPDLV